MTEMEVVYGLLLNPKLATLLKPVMDDLFAAIRVLPYDRKAAHAAALLRGNSSVWDAQLALTTYSMAGTAISCG